ncbi:guanine nucleotide binding protein, alpha subunit [Globomyces pollinis-pini]|nr:guanine nucleotide binding protein, alpha subunit [Globomyces pollinis-pini]
MGSLCSKQIDKTATSKVQDKVNRERLKSILKTEPPPTGSYNSLQKDTPLERNSVANHQRLGGEMSIIRRFHGRDGKDTQAKTAKAVEEYLAVEKNAFLTEAKEAKILILGSSDSGKSTFLKQLKILHGNGFTNEELKRGKLIVYYNILTCINAIIQQMDSHFKEFYIELTKFKIENFQSDGVPVGFAQSVVAFWKDPIVQQTFQDIKYQLPLTIPYFFDKLVKITSDEYTMTNEDMLNVRQETKTISDNVFLVPTIDGLQKFHFFDVSGIVGHRKRWIPYFDNVTAIVFLVGTSTYDQSLQENFNINRMTDALDLFGYIVNHPLLVKPDIMLFFNKIDVFKEKIKTVHIRDFFKDYEGDNDNFEHAIRYFKKQFFKRNKTTKKLISHCTCCTDTSAMRKIVEDVVKAIVTKLLDSLNLM